MKVIAAQDTSLDRIACNGSIEPRLRNLFATSRRFENWW